MGKPFVSPSSQSGWGRPQQLLPGLSWMVVALCGTLRLGQGGHALRQRAHVPALSVPCALQSSAGTWSGSGVRSPCAFSAGRHLATMLRLPQSGAKARPCRPGPSALAVTLRLVARMAVAMRGGSLMVCFGATCAVLTPSGGPWASLSLAKSGRVIRLPLDGVTASDGASIVPRVCR